MPTTLSHRHSSFSYFFKITGNRQEKCLKVKPVLIHKHLAHNGSQIMLLLYISSSWSNTCCCIKYSQFFLLDTQHSLISSNQPDLHFWKMFLVKHFGSFGSNQYDHVFVSWYCRQKFHSQTSKAPPYPCTGLFPVSRHCLFILTLFYSNITRRFHIFIIYHETLFQYKRECVNFIYG